jgi:hypothetical protein
MHKRFAHIVDSLHPSFERMLAMKPVSPSSLPKVMPLSGIYLLSEGKAHLYVGRSRNIRKRLGRHCRPGATYRMAAFAFQLAREETGHLKATYKTNGSRAQLFADPEFRKAFDRAKERIRKMQARFVEEKDPVRQAVLEIYVATVLGTRYNDFDTH